MFGPFERQLHKGSDKWHKKKATWNCYYVFANELAKILRRSVKNSGKRDFSSFATYEVSTIGNDSKYKFSYKTKCNSNYAF